jgi:hypothetical protein
MEKNVIIAEVDDFVRRFSSGELILVPEARKMIWQGTFGEKNFLGRPKLLKKPLPDMLGYCIAIYQLAQTSNGSHLVLEKAYELLDLVQRIRAYGFIRNPQQQARNYEEEIEQLKERVNSLAELNKRLVLENKRLHNLVDNNNKGGAEVGEVGT